MRRSLRVVALFAGVAAVLFLAWSQWTPLSGDEWSDAERGVLRSLWMQRPPPVPPDPSNAVADDPRAAEFGRQLFFDPRLSGDGAVSCATCHQPARRFTDGLPRGRAIGESKRNTMSLIGAAYSPWQYRDGRRDSLWAQALAPLEDPAEHGATRAAIAHLVAGDAAYRDAYESLFGTLPELDDTARFPERAAPAGDPEARRAWQAMTPDDRHRINIVFSNIGKALAAYERLLVPGPSRFDRYVEAVVNGDAAKAAILTPEEVAGLRLFIGKARCTECHNGPLFTNNEFHNTGLLSSPGRLPDRGRIEGVREVRDDPFNCAGPYSDDPARDCPELRFARTGQELLGALRTPSLRNLERTAPFMNEGQLATLEGVIDHYDRAPPALIGHNEAKPLSLGRRERAQLRAFLDTLSAPPATAPEWLSPPGGIRAPDEDAVRIPPDRPATGVP